MVSHRRKIIAITLALLTGAVVMRFLESSPSAAAMITVIGVVLVLIGLAQFLQMRSRRNR